MGFIEHNLTSNEKIVYKGYLHWFSYLKGIFFIVILWAVLMALAYFNAPETWIYLILTLLAACACFIYFRLVRINTEYYITTKRLIVKKGIFQRNTTELRLAKCEGVMVEQSVFGRLFNYGTISITTGEVINTYRFIANPIRFRTMINENLDKLMKDEDDVR